MYKKKPEKFSVSSFRPITSAGSSHFIRFAMFWSGPRLLSFILDSNYIDRIKGRFKAGENKIAQSSFPALNNYFRQGFATAGVCFLLSLKIIKGY